MNSFGFGTLTVALFALVCCSGSDEKAFEVHVRPEKLIVEPKESLKVNCSTTCNQPEVGGLETSLNKILLAEQAQWKHYLISNISHDTVLWCHFTCSGKQESMSSNVSVYHAWSPEINMSVKLPCSPVSILNRRPLPLCTGAGQATSSPTVEHHGDRRWPWPGGGCWGCTPILTGPPSFVPCRASKTGLPHTAAHLGGRGQVLHHRVQGARRGAPGPPHPLPTPWQ
ncbi:intercellular adhesion molecule 2 isoform X4 [Trachypithecus francoisi]|uniref:intercellular adhesion molecule 2 isoform X4 n=1 Tax=Trachypithecus francoisi TaxID=54180 RepID=UPI00141AE418|nr:intercellular adhesion molecule 2 isoform X4 [Trachypithecus francoisi]